MKINRLIVLLQELQSQGHGSLDIYAIDGSSGVSSDIGSPSLQEKSNDDEYGPVSELEDATPYVQLYVGN